MTLLKQLFKYYIYFIIIFFIGRLGLFVLYFDRFSSVEINYYLTFLYGLKMDTMTASIFLVLPMFAVTLLPKIFSKFVNIFFNPNYAIENSKIIKSYKLVS